MTIFGRVSTFIRPITEAGRPIPNMPIKKANLYSHNLHFHSLYITTKRFINNIPAIQVKQRFYFHLPDTTLFQTQVFSSFHQKAF